MLACWLDILRDSLDGFSKGTLGQSVGPSKINMVKAPLSSGCMERSEGLTEKKYAKLDGVPV